MSLVFEPAAPSTPAVLQRADVACFVGFVGRRAGRPLPDALLAQLDAAGWVHGPWRRTPQQIDSLFNLPLALDSWHLFDRYYAWDERPLDGAGTRRCASYLGAAVRSFFARGGRRAIVVRMGDPWPYLESAAQRAAQRAGRLALLLPSLVAPPAPHDPASWQGVQHLHGLSDDSLLLLPDLADCCALVPPPAAETLPLQPLPEGFGPCDDELPAEPDNALHHVPAPRLDAVGFAQWRIALDAARAFLAGLQRATMLVAALPLPQADTQLGSVHAQADLAAYLQAAQVLRDASTEDTQHGRPAEALSQLTWPWLRTRAAQADLPEGLEPPDGALAGLIASTALQRGTFRSAAGDRSLALLRDVGGAEPVPAWGLDDDSPSGRLAQRVCVFAPTCDGWALQSDVTTSAQEPWRFGGASRLIGTVLRAARTAGDSVVFDPNGPRLWAQLRSAIEDLLAGFWAEGAFGGDTMQQAFSVRCDASTMTQNDIDAGRLIAVVSVRPAMAIERITVVLKLGNAATATAEATA